MARLTTRKNIVLGALVRWRWESPPDGPEISGMTGNPREWATPILIALERGSLVERLGKSANNAWCWRITEAGRAALSSKETELE